MPLPPDAHEMPTHVLEAWSSAIASERQARLGVQNGYEIGRDLHEYLAELCGLDAFVEYVRNSSCPHILDIGAGEKALALSQLKAGPLGRGLTYEATGLMLPRANEAPKDPILYRHAGAESLHGVRKASVGGAIAVYSLMYSSDAAMTGTAINRVLMPGGVLKAVFPLDFGHDAGVTAEELGDALTALGYDVAVKGRFTDIVTAIKPGAPPRVTAEVLYEQDMQHWIAARESPVA